MILGLLLGAANPPDQELFEAVLDEVAPVATPKGGRRRRPDKCHADKGYDYRHCRSYLTGRGSRSASPAAASSHPSGWAATAGRRSSRSPGCLAAGGCGSATTGARSGSTRSGCWAAAGCRSTATPTTPPNGPAGQCWPGSHLLPQPRAVRVIPGCSPSARTRADRDHLVACEEHPKPGSDVPAARLAGSGGSASPIGADAGHPAAATCPTNAPIQLRECPLSLGAPFQ